MNTAELVATLRSETPGTHSTWHHLATLLESGALQLVAGDGAARVSGSHVQLPVGAADLASVRSAWWRAFVRRKRPGSPVPPDTWTALATLSAAQDPGREVLSRLLSEAPPLHPPPGQDSASRGWLRHHLFHTLSARPRPEAEKLLPTEALADPPNIPPPRSDPQTDVARVAWLTSHLRSGARIGLVGAAASGKSTLAGAAQRACSVPVHSADDFTWPGDGFRYTQHRTHRHTVLSGPYITHHEALLNTVRATQGPLIVEGTTVGWDPELRGELDLLVFVHLPAETRLARKASRDHSTRTLALRLDFAEKQFLELQDVCIPVSLSADSVWHRSALDEGPQT